ncbi:MAG: AraC family transcriptional regulator [Clostridiales bacterium]|nr:AraC family transcriptional regulator [Clostridiales bacterium]
MVQYYVFSPHYDFYINKAQRSGGYSMSSFHFHKKYEIYYQLSGTRKYFIEDSAYFINVGNVVLIDQSEIHKASSVHDEPHARVVLNFCEELIAPVARCFPDVDLLALFHSGQKVLALDMRARAQTEEILAKLVTAGACETPTAVAMRRLLLCELLVLLTEYKASQSKAERDAARISNKTIDAVAGYVSAHYREKLTLDVLAGRFHLSRCYLSRLFKQTTNIGVMEYVNGVRLRAAKDLLENTATPVSEVAQEVGYATPGHFSRMFRIGTGLSPKEYRKMFRVQP